jgi:urease alpha subunit
MRQAIVVAVIAALPPTLAAVLAFATSRSTAHSIKGEDPQSVHSSIAALSAAVARVEATTTSTAATATRTEQHVGELRERVSRLEGAAAVPEPRR